MRRGSITRALGTLLAAAFFAAGTAGRSRPR